jgi:hypothetical protein
VISTLTLKVQAKGIDAADKSVKSLAQNVGALQQAIEALAKSGPAIQSVAKDLKVAASAAAKMSGAASGIMALTQAMQGFAAAASAAGAASGQMAIKDYAAALKSLQGAGGRPSPVPDPPDPKPVHNIRTALEGMSPAFAAVSGGFAQIGQGIQSAQAFMQPLTGAVQSGIAAFQQFKAVIDEATGALLKMGQEGAQISQLNTAFEAIGGSAKKMEELRGMTGGIVDDVALQKAFNMATLFDIPRDKIPAMLKAAQGASIAMGISAEKAVNDVMVAIARKSKPIADNIGVQMGNLKDVYQKFADSAGKSVNKLTEEEKNLAFINTFLEKSTRQMELAGAAQSNVFSQMSAKATNASNEFKVFVSELLAGSGALDFVSSGMTTMKAAFETAPKGVLQGAMKTLFATGMELGKMLVPVFSAAVPVITLALDLFNIFAPVITSTLGVAGKLTQGLVLAVRVGMIPFVRMLEIVIDAVQGLADTVGISTPTLDAMSDGIKQMLANNKAMIDAAGVEVAIEPKPVIAKTDAEKFAEVASADLQEKLKGMERDAQVVLALTVKPEVKEDATGMGNAVEMGGEFYAKFAKRKADAEKELQVAQATGIGDPDKLKAKIAEYDLIMTDIMGKREAELRAQAAQSVQNSLGKGLNEGLVMAAQYNSAAAAELFSGMGADISGASEMGLIKAAQELKASAQGGMVAQGMRGVATALVGNFVDGLGGGMGGAAQAELQNAMGMVMQGLSGDGVSGSDLIKFGSVAKAEAAGGLKLFTKEMRAVAGEVPLFNSHISEMDKHLQTTFAGEHAKRYEDFLSGAYEQVQKFGLIKQDAPFQLMTTNDINALLDYQNTVTALTDTGEEVTGEQALMINAMRAAGDSASGAVSGLQEYEKQLIGVGNALGVMRQAAIAAGQDDSGFVAMLERQAAQLKVVAGAIKAAEKEKDKQDKGKGGGKKGDGGRQALLDRAAMVGLSEIEAMRRKAEQQLAKDMKTAGASAELKAAAQKIYHDAMVKPALMELESMGGAFALVGEGLAAGFKGSLKAVFGNEEVSAMVREARTNLMRAGLEMEVIDLGDGRSRKRTDREVGVVMELKALEEEWAAKKALLAEGSEAYLMVYSDYLLKKKALEDEGKTDPEAALEALKSFEGVFGQVQSTYDSLLTAGSNGEQAVAALTGTVLMLGEDMSGLTSQFKDLDKAVTEGKLTGGQADVMKANAVVGAAGRAAAGVIKNERARAAVQGAVEVALAASSFAIGDIAGGIAHTAAAGLFFAAAGRGSGASAATRSITPRRSAAGSDRQSTAGDRRQAQTQVNIYINPLSGRAMVDEVNRAAQRQAGVAFNSRVMQGAARRPEL